MHAGYPHIIEPLRATAHCPGGHRSFFRNWDVSRAGADDQYRAFGRFSSVYSQLNNTRVFKIFSRRNAGSDRVEGFTRSPCRQHTRMLLIEPLHDLDDAIRAFALAEHDFGKTLAQRSMMIEARIT